MFVTNTIPGKKSSDELVKNPYSGIIPMMYLQATQ